MGGNQDLTKRLRGDIIRKQFGLVAQLGAHHIRIVGVEGSNPFKSTTKETSFVYQDKRGFFILFGAK